MLRKTPRRYLRIFSVLLDIIKCYQPTCFDPLDVRCGVRNARSEHARDLMSGSRMDEAVALLANVPVTSSENRVGADVTFYKVYPTSSQIVEVSTYRSLKPKATSEN
jgi:hypothetical protein